MLVQQEAHAGCLHAKHRRALGQLGEEMARPGMARRVEHHAIEPGGPCQPARLGEVGEIGRRPFGRLDRRPVGDDDGSGGVHAPASASISRA
jgi:hypothetical protein